MGLKWATYKTTEMTGLNSTVEKEFLRGKEKKKCKRTNTRRRLKQSVQQAGGGESRPSQASASTAPRSLNAP